MIPRQKFGRAEHESTRVIFGSWALSKATQSEADRALKLLQEYGVNHIDTAPMYGNAEKLLGPWLAKHRDDFFVATKTRSRTRQGALANLKRSLDLLHTDYIDLWQMHGLTSQAGWNQTMGQDGALEAFIEARDQGLVRFLGVTGHGTRTPAMHQHSLARFDFDTVLLPYNYLLMQNSSYAADFTELMNLCRERRVAIQTIKSVARRPWGDQPKTYHTYFYEPLDAQDAIDKVVHWSLSLPGSFLITPGDLQLLPKVLNAANRFEERPSEEEMRTLVDKFGMQQIFQSVRSSGRGKGPQTWGGQVYRTLEELIRDGFFRYPDKRNVKQVIDVLESRGPSVRGREDKIAGFLARRGRKGVLKKTKGPDGWVYWTE